MIILLITIMGMGEKENGKWRTFKEKTIKKSSEYAATSKTKFMSNSTQNLDGKNKTFVYTMLISLETYKGTTCKIACEAACRPPRKS